MTSAPSIFIIDDLVDNRFVLHHLFKNYFPLYQARFFTDGQMFIDELPHISETPELILLDQHMPDLDGYHTLLRLRQNKVYKLIPVVMMSADASSEEINVCYEAGANSFIIKPIDFISLKNKLLDVCHYWLDVNKRHLEQ